MTKTFVDMPRLLAEHNEATGQELKQEQFCKLYNMTTATFGNYKLGKAPLVLGDLKRAAEVAGKTLDDYITVKDEQDENV